jgi:hypothetical protein
MLRILGSRFPVWKLWKMEHRDAKIILRGAHKALENNSLDGDYVAQPEMDHSPDFEIVWKRRIV